MNQMRWCTGVVAALGKQREEDREFKVILAYTKNSKPSGPSRRRLKTKQKKKKQRLPLTVVASEAKDEKIATLAWDSHTPECVTSPSAPVPLLYRATAGSSAADPW